MTKRGGLGYLTRAKAALVRDDGKLGGGMGKKRQGRGKVSGGNSGFGEANFPTSRKNGEKWGTPIKFKTRKEQGEWAELGFMMRAKGLGFGVLKPYGDSRAYDVAVEDGGPIVRVQVKCTTYCRRGNEYSLNVLGPGRKPYPKGSVEFFAVFIIPLNEWYIVPYAAMGTRGTMHVTAGSKRAKWARYLEAWSLLREASSGAIEIQACVDQEFDAKEGMSLAEAGFTAPEGPLCFSGASLLLHRCPEQTRVSFGT